MLLLNLSFESSPTYTFFRLYPQFHASIKAVEHIFLASRQHAATPTTSASPEGLLLVPVNVVKDQAEIEDTKSQGGDVQGPSDLVPHNEVFLDALDGKNLVAANEHDAVVDYHKPVALFIGLHNHGEGALNQGKYDVELGGPLDTNIHDCHRDHKCELAYQLQGTEPH